MIQSNPLRYARFRSLQGLAGALALVLVLANCSSSSGGGGGSDDSDSSSTVTLSGDCSADSTYMGMDICTIWEFNTTTTSAEMTDSDGSTMLVNVQSAQVGTSSGGTVYIAIGATGIPSYTYTFTAGDITALNARPNAATDFKAPPPFETTATALSTYDWGADINFKNQLLNACYTTQGGEGWWPPGPSCPTDQSKVVYIPVDPAPATQTCYTETGQIGVYLNGVSIYNWSDDSTYESEGVWHNNALSFEQYDLDVCLGHATQDGDYHQHGQANCLETQMGDPGTAHSPIYGYAADGYPIYGRWYASGQEALSRWTARNYSTTSSPGCPEGSGRRTCVLNDPTDYTQGTTNVTEGPTTSEIVTSLSGNDFTVTSGFYFEDYYYDASLTDVDDRYLDQHNGHDHDSLGYHYHITTSWPYNIGPSYYGKLDSHTIASCSTTPY